MNQYLIRLDDACPTMDRAKWDRMESILDKYDVKPLVGVIPHNEDPKQMIDSSDEGFWDKVHQWEQKDWAIALHGYNHVYSSSEGGINPLWNKSEFAGHPLEIQIEKIRKGISILREHNINPKYFFAPSHTFDMNTLVALKQESDIHIISDTIATKPYIKDGFIFIPQVGGSCRKMFIPGVWTFCLHPSTMSESALLNTDSFIRVHKDYFRSFGEVNLVGLTSKDIFSRIFAYFYFINRRLRRVK